MAQNTNAVAYTRLKPIQNNDIGRLVEEHIRYWKKYDDDEKAKQNALALQQAKYQLDLRKLRREDIDKLEMPDTVPYLQDQLLNDFNNNIKPLYLKYADAYEKTGDKSYLIEMEKLKNTVNNYGKLKEYYAQRVKELKEAEQKGTLNPYLDKDKINFFKGTAKGQYYINKGKAYVLDGDKLKEYNLFDPNSPLFTPITGSGNPNFYELGKNIQGLVKIDSKDGNKILSKTDRRRIFDTTKSNLMTNEVAWKTWKASQGYDPNKTLSIDEQNKLIKDFQDKYVYIQQVDNSLENAKKIADINKSRTTTRNQQANGISIATEGRKGIPLKAYKGQTYGDLYNKIEYFINAEGKNNEQVMLKAPKGKDSYVLNNYAVVNGKPVALVTVVETKPIETILKDADGKEYTIQENKVVDTKGYKVINDPLLLNAFAKKTMKGTDKHSTYNNVTELIQDADRLYQSQFGKKPQEKPQGVISIGGVKNYKK